MVASRNQNPLSVLDKEVVPRSDSETMIVLIEQVSELAERLTVQEEITRQLVRRLAQVEWDRPSVSVNEG